MLTLHKMNLSLNSVHSNFWLKQPNYAEFCHK